MCSSESGGLAAMAAGLDALATDDLYGVSGPGLLDRTAVFIAQRNRLDAELARTVRRAELAQAPESDGLKSMAARLRGHCRLSIAPAAQWGPVGRAVEQLPPRAAPPPPGGGAARHGDVLSPLVKPGNLAPA